ncbi:dephospho-CoA kinase [Helicobacter apodemus]|uniref:Dephospho-CoA kinase n=1 Tax=Helicobacter apodemus TaxID=135569 RepID=A0A4U8UIJ4_9HELI|nr:dephospho-CoA kinase [Helicobacter apodemus]TLE17219.1 dephospho-CoA kinase [Helicobacter apodemus]
MNFQYAIALTGGIGSGKSTAASLLKLYGYAIIDADTIAHKALEQSTEEVIEIFSDIILTEGKIDRKKLANIVFKNKALRNKLENLLHPRIKEYILEQSHLLDGKNIPYFIDIPLFFETKHYDIEETLLIFVEQSTQIERIKKRNALSDEAILERINAQIPLHQKKKLAKYVINNNGDLKNLQKEIEKYLQNYLPNIKF